MQWGSFALRVAIFYAQYMYACMYVCMQISYFKYMQIEPEHQDSGCLVEQLGGV